MYKYWALAHHHHSERNKAKLNHCMNALLSLHSLQGQGLQLSHEFVEGEAHDVVVAAVDALHQAASDALNAVRTCKHSTHKPTQAYGTRHTIQRREEKEGRGQNAEVIRIAHGTRYMTQGMQQTQQASKKCELKAGRGGVQAATQHNAAQKIQNAVNRPGTFQGTRRRGKVTGENKSLVRS